MKMQLAEIAQALEVPLDPQWAEVEVTSVSFDSRTLEPGALFIPLTDVNDGHDYIESAIGNGAVATLWQTDHAENQPAVPHLVVKDSLLALQKLAKYYLHKINPKVVAVTGSNGKTTTKDMCAAVLKTQFNVQKTFANFNNQIGVPLTILAMEPYTEVLVVELGMDHAGELDVLSKIVEPDVAVITMVGEAHIEFFGTRDKIADAKMEIVNGLKEDGVLVYNGDEPLLVEKTTDLPQECVTFGIDQAISTDYVATSITPLGTSTAFTVNQLPEDIFTIPMMGDYNVSNALAAIAVGRIFKITPANLKAALQQFDLTKNRTEWLTGAKGEQILSDVYNSNPTAAKEVLKTVAQVETVGKRIAVLGDMLELGEQGGLMHQSLAEQLHPETIQSVYLYGPLMAQLGKKLQAYYPANSVHIYGLDQKDQLINDLQAEVAADDLVFLKGSHGVHLEEVVESLKN